MGNRVINIADISLFDAIQIFVGSNEQLNPRSAIEDRFDHHIRRPSLRDVELSISAEIQVHLHCDSLINLSICSRWRSTPLVFTWQFEGPYNFSIFRI